VPVRGAGAAAALLGVAVLLAACATSHSVGGVGSSTTEPGTSAPGSGSSTTATTATPSSLPAAGTYVDGPSDQPHYALVLAVGPAGALSGTLNFVYQDGRTAAQFTFSGTAASGTAQLTSHGGGPGAFTAGYAPGRFVLSGCTAYLQYAMSAAACTFSSA